MMKMKFGFLVVVVILLMISMVFSVKGDSGVIVIDGADGSNNISTTSSPDLAGLISNVANHFTVEFANELHIYEIGPASGELLSLINTVDHRPIIEFANALRYYHLGYPTALINDTTNPSVSNLSVMCSGSSATFILILSELSTAKVEFGAQAGVYTSSKTVDKFLTHHEITFSGVTPDSKYYYRITLVDRSGNTYVSPGDSFTSSSSIYVPFINR